MESGDVAEADLGPVQCERSAGGRSRSLAEVHAAGLALRGHVVAITKPKIYREEARVRTRAAHSGYEHAAIGWVPLRHALVRAFIRGKRRKYPDKVGSTLDVNRRTWIKQSRLGVLEAWRFRNALDD
jgi:hypothetical protein